MSTSPSPSPTSIWVRGTLTAVTLVVSFILSPIAIWTVSTTVQNEKDGAVLSSKLDDVRREVDSTHQDVKDLRHQLERLFETKKKGVIP